MSTKPDPSAISSDLATLRDGTWDRRDVLAIGRLLTQLGILLALAAPLVCAATGDQDAPAGESDTDEAAESGSG